MISVTSEDIGAPTLNEEPGTLMAVLRFALPQLGWTEEFVDEQIHACAFRNDIASGATGHYLEILDSNAAHGGDDFRARFYGYSDMAGIGQGDGQFPVGTSAWVARSFGTSQQANKWRVVGDAKAFWLLHNPEGYNSSNQDRACFWYFGDAARFSDSDTSLFLVSGSSGSVGVTSNHSVFESLGSVQRLQAAESAVDQSVGVNVRPVNTPAEGSTSSLQSGIQGDAYPAVIGGGLTNAPITLREGDRYRGMFRGVYAILVNVESAMSGGQIVEDVNTFKGNRTVEIIKLTSRPRISVFTPILSLAFDTDWSDW